MILQSDKINQNLQIVIPSDEIDHLIPEQTEPPDIIEIGKLGPKVPGLNVALLIY